MTALYRAGVIGCGTIARAHAAAYAQASRTALVALADVRIESAQALGAEYGLDPGHAYDEARRMLAQEDLDIVSICTWAQLHAPMTELAAAAGVKAVVCEKPLALDLAQVDRMLAACDAAGTKLIVSHQHRFNPYCAAARRLLAAGCIGEPHLIHLQTGRGLFNNGSHYLDMARFLLDDAPWEWVLAQVQRDTDRYERGARIEDRCLAMAGFAGGVRVVLETDLPDPHQGEWRVYGARGQLRFSTRGLQVVNEAGGPREIAIEPGPGSHAAQLDELIAWLEGGAGHRGDAHRHRHTIELMIGMYKSARRRTLIRPPLTSGSSPLEAMIDDGTLPVRIPGRVDI